MKITILILFVIVNLIILKPYECIAQENAIPKNKTLESLFRTQEEKDEFIKALTEELRKERAIKEGFLSGLTLGLFKPDPILTEKHPVITELAKTIGLLIPLAIITFIFRKLLKRIIKKTVDSISIISRRLKSMETRKKQLMAIWGTAIAIVLACIYPPKSPAWVKPLYLQWEFLWDTSSGYSVNFGILFLEIFIIALIGGVLIYTLREKNKI